MVQPAVEVGLTSSPVLEAQHATKYAMVGLSESLALALEGTPANVSCPCLKLVDIKIFESARIAPVAIGLPSPSNVFIEQIAGCMGTVAMPPVDLEADLVYPVRTGSSGFSPTSPRWLESTSAIVSSSRGAIPSSGTGPRAAGDRRSHPRP